MHPVFVGKTAFPMKGQLRAEQTSFVASGQNTKATYRFLDGPPYANGALHLGHVMNKSLKDMVVRAVRAMGQTPVWQAGWDCHGLPVEVKVEQAGHSRSNHAEFCTHARAYALSQVDLQRETFRSQGLCADFDSPYLTLHQKQEADTLRVLAKMVEHGLVYSADKATHWCTECGSTLASFEQEDTDCTELSCFAAFARPDGSVFLAWTTTPWTLAYHEALVVSPTGEYGLFELPQGKAWFALASKERVLSAYGVEQDLQPLEVVLGESLNHAEYTKPFGGVSHVVVDNVANPEGGTGVLHAVPAFGFDDFELGKRHNLPVTHDLQENGVFTQDSPYVTHAGVHMRTANKNSLDWLAENSPWHVMQKYKTVKPYCWRHKVPLLVRPSRQWYLNLDGDVRARALSMLDTVKFVPESGKARLYDAVAKRPDWCLSRQRTWGVPMALFVHKETGALHPNTVELMRKAADLLEEKGLEAWWSSSDSDWVDASVYERVWDVLDVWFDSGVCRYVTENAHMVPDMVLEGHDQHRGWFQSSLLVAAALGNEAPYKTVVTHGFVVDNTGKKLSKSEGGDKKQSNQKVPSWTELPADVVRVWSGQSACHTDKVWGLDELTLAKNMYDKFRNSVRFALSNLGDCPMYTEYDASQWWASDLWAVEQARMVKASVLQSFADAKFEVATAELHSFANETLSKTYYGMLKDRLYCGAENGTERRSAQQALHTVLMYYMDALDVLAPNLVREALALLPEHLRSAVQVTNVTESGADVLYKLRQATAAQWAPHSDKAGGSVQMAGVQLALQTAWGFKDHDVLEWLGVSEVVYHDYTTVTSDDVYAGVKLNVYRKDGVVCPRCRWVVDALVDDECGRCHTRNES